MLDFIIEHIWIFVISGGVVILIAIGYIVDKFIIHKDNNVQKAKPNEEKVEENTEPVAETTEVVETPVEEVAEASTENIEEAPAETVEEVKEENPIETPVVESTEEIEQKENGESVVKTEPLSPDENKSGNDSPWEV